MKSIKRYPLLFLGLALAMIVMSACSQGSASSSLTPLQVVQKSADAMKNLQTSHQDLNLTFQTNGVSTNDHDQQMLSNVAIKGSGDESIPDKQQKMDLTVTLPNTSAQISDVMTSDKTYIKIAQNQWYVIDRTKFDQSGGSVISNLFSGTSIDENTLLGLVEHVNVTDHGDENLNGQSLRHITANIDKAALQQLLSDNPQLWSKLGVQDQKAMLNAVKDLNATADLYVDENQFYVHRTELKVKLGTDENGKTVNTNLDLIVDLSNFNQPVTITVPTNAKPLTDPKQLLSGLSAPQQ